MEPLEFTLMQSGQYTSSGGAGARTYSLVITSDHGAVTDVSADTVAWFVGIDHLILDDRSGSFVPNLGLLLLL